MVCMYVCVTCVYYDGGALMTLVRCCLLVVTCATLNVQKDHDRASIAIQKIYLFVLCIFLDLDLVESRLFA